MPSPRFRGKVGRNVSSGSASTPRSHRGRGPVPPTGRGPASGSAQGDLAVGQAGAGGALLGGQRRVVGQRLGQVGGEPLGRLLERLRRRCRRAGPRPGRAGRGRGTCPTRREPVGDLVAAGGVQPGERVEQLGPRARASPSAGAPWCRRWSSTPPRRVVSRADGEAAALACSSAAAMAGSSSTSATQKPKPSCTVTSSGSSVTRSCSRGPAPGGSVRPTMPGSPGRPAPLAARPPRSRDGSPKWCCTCSPSQIWPLSRTIAGAAIGSSEQSVTLRGRCRLFSVSGAVAAGHQLAQRDHVALRRHALERAGDEDRGRAAGGAVAGLVALARAARAGLARADLALGERAGGVTGLGAGALAMGANLYGASPACNRLAASSRSSMYAGRSVMTAVTPRSRQS